MLAVNLKKSDDLSALIFLSYFASFNQNAQKKINALIKKPLFEDYLACPVQAPFAQSLVKTKLKIDSNFQSESSGSLSHGYPALILRILCEGKLTAKKRKQIEKELEALEKISYKKGRCIFWLNNFIDINGKNQLGIFLSLNRGIGGVIAVLSLCYTLKIKPKFCMRLLDGVINQVLKIEKETKGQGLPNFWGNKALPQVKRHACFYGDPPMGYMLALAGYRCQKKNWIKHGKRIFLRGISETPKSASIKNYNLAMGAGGMSHIAFRFYELTGEKESLRHAKRWLKIAERMYQKSQTRPALKNQKFPDTIHNSILGLNMISWFQEGKIDGRWDSMYGLSNPVSGQIV